MKSAAEVLTTTGMVEMISVSLGVVGARPTPLMFRLCVPRARADVSGPWPQRARGFRHANARGLAAAIVAELSVGVAGELAGPGARRWNWQLPEERVPKLNSLLRGWCGYFNQGPVTKVYQLIRKYAEPRCSALAGRWLSGSERFLLPVVGNTVSARRGPTIKA